MITINEAGKGRRIRCPICNCMFTFDQQDVNISTKHEATIACPHCSTNLYIDLVIKPKQDIFVAGKA